MGRHKGDGGGKGRGKGGEKGGGSADASEFRVLRLILAQWVFPFVLVPSTWFAIVIHFNSHKSLPALPNELTTDNPDEGFPIRPPVQIHGEFEVFSKCGPVRELLLRDAIVEVQRRWRTVGKWRRDW